MGKQIFYGICILTGALVGYGIYTWQQLTYLPIEYQVSGDRFRQELSAEQWLSEKLEIRENNSNITLNEAEVSQLLANTLASKNDSEALLRASRGINTSIQENRIETGIILNLAELPRELLSPEATQLINQLEQSMPLVVNREVYVSFSGKPQVQEGRLVLGDNALIKVGRFQLPLVDLVTQLGMTSEEFEARLTDYFNRNDISLKSIDFQDEQIIINFQP